MSSIKNGFELTKQSIKTFFHRPQLAIPLIICWVLYVFITLYFEFFIDWSQYDSRSVWLVLLFQIFSYALILSWSMFALLHMVRYIENGRTVNLKRSLWVAFTHLLKALPVVLFWVFIWFTITVIEIIIRRFKGNANDDENLEFSAKNVAETLSGDDETSFSGSLLNALQKGVRMLAFLIYPAIAWENHGIRKSIKKGFHVGWMRKKEMAAGFVLTELAAFVIFLPASLLLIFSNKTGVEFNDAVWVMVILYIGFAWSFAMFIEQLFVAELYLWHVMWEKECRLRKLKKLPMPEFNEIKRPCLMDDVNDMEKTNIRSD